MIFFFLTAKTCLYETMIFFYGTVGVISLDLAWSPAAEAQAFESVFLVTLFFLLLNLFLRQKQNRRLALAIKESRKKN